ncbi:anti-sigma factor [Pseudomonas sp. C 49-2]|uniref:zf-HC2 domain-containing protein n=1 Tax=Pseudomonas sp. C 49-2 TaxID=2496849 RepID=UPI000F8227A3|nr:zf-HC2 domain-containing protein [Pseudomonas sp. C 49-2]RTX99467.1 anti-sigma factor [Pseudomonas sp. C 49-2]
MLTCKEQVARSSDYLDGQLTFRERLLVRHHLMFCPNCRRFIRQMRLMQATLKIMPDEPGEGMEALAQRLAEERLKDHKGGE